MKSIQLHDSIEGLSQKIVSITLHYITLQAWFLPTKFLCPVKIMYPENPEGAQVILDSMNMGYISDTARNRIHNLFRPKREPIPLGHSDG